MDEAKSFTPLSGREKIVEYSPVSPFKYQRLFCGACGTSIGELTSESDMFPIPANCFDVDLEKPELEPASWPSQFFDHDFDPV